MRRMVLLVLIMVIVLLSGMSVFFRVQAIKRQELFRREGIESIQMREGFPVRVVPVRQGTFEVWREIQGKVEGFRQAFLSTPDPARVAKIRHRVGDKVAADTPIISLDETDPKSLSRIQLLRSVYEDALREYQRYEVLWKSGGISRDVVDKRQLMLKTAKSDLDAARATVHLTSPISGVLLSLSIREGENAEPGKTLGVVAVMDPVRIVARVSRRDVEELKAGQSVRVSSVSGHVSEGRVDRISIGANLETGLFDLEMVVDNRNLELIVGTFVTARVRVWLREEVYSMDSLCLLRDVDGRDFVYQVEDGKAKKTFVQVMAQNDDFSMITGIHPDLQVVISGKSLLWDGVKVRILNAEESAEDKEWS